MKSQEEGRDALFLHLQYIAKHPLLPRLHKGTCSCSDQYCICHPNAREIVCHLLSYAALKIALVFQKVRYFETNEAKQSHWVNACSRFVSGKEYQYQCVNENKYL